MGIPKNRKRKITKTAGVLFISLVCLLADRNVAPACHSVGDSPCSLGMESVHLRVGNDLDAGGYLPPSVDRTNYLQALSCPDIASTNLFASEELEYVHSAEFAEAVFAVATGNSRFSPPRIPPEWLSTAFAWGTHIAASKTLPSRIDDRSVSSPSLLPENGNACSPSLLFRASLEYRSSSGHEEVKLVYPYKVRAGSESLAKATRDATVTTRKGDIGTALSRPAGGTGEKTGADGQYEHSVDSAIRWIAEHGLNSRP